MDGPSKEIMDILHDDPYLFSFEYGSNHRSEQSVMSFYNKLFDRESYTAIPDETYLLPFSSEKSKVVPVWATRHVR